MTRSVERLDGVLVVGGGYAGVHAAQAAQKLGARVTLIDPTGEHVFVPRLAAVAGGSAPVENASAPLSEFVETVRIGSVEKVGDGEVRLDDGTWLAADAVVVTAGAVPTEPPIDGIEFAMPLRTRHDAQALRRSIDSADSLIIVGGGATGVQLAGAAADKHPQLTVHLVESDTMLIASMGDLGKHARRILEDRAVDVRVDSEVESIDEDGAGLASGERLEGIVAWAAGFDARADALGVDVNEDGRILVDDQLRIMGMERTFAAGDCALHVDEQREPLPMSAQVAVKAGSHAGKNAARLVVGGALEAGDLDHIGWVLDLGGWRGVAKIGPVSIDSSPFDRLAPLLHAAIDIKHLVEIGGPAAVWAHRPSLG